jgi:thioredoxin reductase
VTEYDLIVVGDGPAGTKAARAAAEAGQRVAFLPSHQVWSVTGRFRVDMVGPNGAAFPAAPRLIVATEAHPRIVPFPGWTLPGVVGLADTNVMPGQSVVVAGHGPHLAAVATAITRAGGRVLAIADAANASAWLAAPYRLTHGTSWYLRSPGARIPVLFRHAVRRAEGNGTLARVVLAPLSGEGAWRNGAEHVLPASLLAVGHGMVPDTGIPRLLRAAQKFDRRLGTWVPRLDAAGRTSIQGLSVIGEPISHPCPLHPARIAAIPPETIICRCEDVTAAAIIAAAHDGAAEVNQLKQFTRCGMGPCQGRICGDMAAELLAQARAVPRDAVGFWTGRPPLQPVPLADLLGTFTYADIPVPSPAPL